MAFWKKNWKSLGLTTLYSVLFTVLLPATAKSTQTAASGTSTDASGSYAIAQAANCREVSVNTALNIRETPNGTIIGQLYDEQTVVITGEPVNGWVGINEPIDGYLSTDYLIYVTLTPQFPLDPCLMNEFPPV